jgi:hypothetical protein
MAFLRPVYIAAFLSRHDLRIKKACQRLIRTISVTVPDTGFCVIARMLWRPIWLLKHTRH